MGEAPGVATVITAADMPGENTCGPELADVPILAPRLVQYVGQAVFCVAAITVEQARKAARLANIAYDDLPPLLDPLAALEAGSFVLPTETIKRGDRKSVV